MSVISRGLKMGAAATVAVLALASCGDNKETSPNEDTSTNTNCSNMTGGMGAGNDLKIISLSPTATEMVYAIGAGDQVIGVDNMSNYPESAGGADSKLSGFEPNVEAIAGMGPDVVLISYDPGDLESQLDSLGIDVWTGVAAATIDDTYSQINELGELTGHESGATKVIDCMDAAITAITDSRSGSSPTTYYYELDNTYYSVTSNTFVGQLLQGFGMTSIADGVEEGNDYPQLNIETIVSADPDFIFLADTKCCGQNAAEIAARPGWSEMSAVTGNKIVELDDDIASRWGPRVVDLLATIANATR